MKISRIVFLVASVISVNLAVAEPSSSYLSIYLQGQKIGYSHFSERKLKKDGKLYTEEQSESKIAAALLGNSLDLTESGDTWIAPSGELARMRMIETSGGRTSSTTAVFSSKKIHVVINSQGNSTQRILAIPTDAQIVDDPLRLFASPSQRNSRSKKYYILDPQTGTLIANTIQDFGHKDITIDGKTVSTHHYQIVDPRASIDVYLDAKRDLVQAIGPLGMVLKPASPVDALSTSGHNARIDLAISSKITPENPLVNPEHLKELSLLLSGPTLPGTVPQTSYQTSKVTSDGVQIDIITTTGIDPTASIAAAAASQPEWTKPDTNVPCDDPKMVQLSKSIIGDSKTVADAALKIQLYVNSIMVPDASIGVLRDAREVLRTKRGVCRDYAILCGTLLRAAKIPTQFCTGLVSWDGDFYYHAWVAIFDGKEWVGVDSTVQDPRFSACHVTLGMGSFAQAYTSPIFNQVTIKVLSQQ